MKTFFICLPAILLVGCRNSDVSVYQVSKEKSQATVLAAPSAPATQDLRWDIPGGWAQRPADGMRKASFTVAGKDGGQADVSIVVLPGDAGGVLANVNRWRGQLGLDGFSESELAAAASYPKNRAGKILLVDMTGQAEGSKKRLVAAILPAQGSTWFFKMTGDKTVVAQAKPSFGEFLGSLRFDSQ